MYSGYITSVSNMNFLYALSTGGYAPFASVAYRFRHSPICLRLFTQAERRADSLAFASAGSRIAARIPIIAMTTSSSTRVNPLRPRNSLLIVPSFRQTKAQFPHTLKNTHHGAVRTLSHYEQVVRTGILFLPPPLRCRNDLDRNLKTGNIWIAITVLYGPSLMILSLALGLDYHSSIKLIII